MQTEHPTTIHGILPALPPRRQPSLASHWRREHDRRRWVIARSVFDTQSLTASLDDDHASRSIGWLRSRPRSQGPAPHTPEDGGGLPLVAAAMAAVAAIHGIDTIAQQPASAPDTSPAPLSIAGSETIETAGTSPNARAGNPRERSAGPAPLVASLASLVLPGSGQAINEERRKAGIFRISSFLTLVALDLVVFREPLTRAFPTIAALGLQGASMALLAGACLWLLSAYDAFVVAAARRAVPRGL